MTRKAIKMMCHALGYRATAKSWPVEPYRNGYAVCGGTPDYDIWMDLVEVGNAAHRRAPSELTPYHHFSVTEQGKGWLLERLQAVPIHERKAIEGTR